MYKHMRDLDTNIYSYTTALRMNCMRIHVLRIFAVTTNKSLYISTLAIIY